MYKNNNLLCSLCQIAVEDQQHLLICEVLKRNLKTTQIASNRIKYEHIYSEDIKEQKEIAALYIEIFKVKSHFEEQRISHVAPSTSDMVLMMSDNLPHGIVCSSFGK